MHRNATQTVTRTQGPWSCENANFEVVSCLSIFRSRVLVVVGIIFCE